MILGNHDEFLLDFLEEDFRDFEWNCLNNGLWETLKFRWTTRKMNHLRFGFLEKWELRNMILSKNPTLLPFLKSMVPVVMIDDNIITHGGFKKVDLGSEKWEVVKPNFLRYEQNFVAKTKSRYSIYIYIWALVCFSSTKNSTKK